jgi:hypothetical protein
MADYGEVKIRTGKVDDLIAIYKDSYLKVSNEIIDATTAGKIRKAQVLAQIKQELTDLGVKVDTWIKEEIPKYYLDGTNIAQQDLKALGVDLAKTANFTVINKAAIAALTDETALAFAEGITGIYRNSAMLLSDALKQQLNFTIAQGKLTGDALKTITANVEQKLKENGLAALIDKGGKQWQFDTYSEMLVRTKAVEARNQGLTNRMLGSGYDLVQVSDHSTTCQLCGPWEGDILSLTGQTDGYDTLDDAEASGLFHPNCQHAINVIDPELADKTQAYDNPFNH